MISTDFEKEENVLRKIDRLIFFVCCHAILLQIRSHRGFNVN